MRNQINVVFPYILIFAGLLIFFSACNNPFSTRDPENPGTEGAAIKPSTSPENLLYNLEAAFEAMSIQDYLDVFSQDFIFSPDPDDSVAYVEDFRGGWNYDRETDFAYNFLQRKNFKSDIDLPIELTLSYKSGQDRYECTYHMFITEADSGEVDFKRIEVEGEAWLYLREDADGIWSVFWWVDFGITPGSLTWGELRAQNI